MLSNPLRSEVRRNISRSPLSRSLHLATSSLPHTDTKVRSIYTLTTHRKLTQPSPRAVGFESGSSLLDTPTTTPSLARVD